MSQPEHPVCCRGTGAGLFALLAWSTAIAFSRSLMEQMGTLTAVATIYLPAGVLACLFSVWRGDMARTLRMPRSYLLVCGGLFLVYEVCLTLALGLAPSGRVAAQAGLINYLWPAFTLLFSVPIRQRQPRYQYLVPGNLIALTGVFLAARTETGPAFAWEHAGIFLLAFVASVAWGLYSNLGARLAGDKEGNGAPLFLLASGVVFLAILPFVHEQAVMWRPRLTWELAYTALIPTTMAYIAWDFAMRRGNATLLASLSYLIPLVSTIITCRYLHVPMGWSLWCGSVLVVAGAVLCSRGIRSTQ